MISINLFAQQESSNNNSFCANNGDSLCFTEGYNSINNSLEDIIDQKTEEELFQHSSDINEMENSTVKLSDNEDFQHISGINLSDLIPNNDKTFEGIYAKTLALNDYSKRINSGNYADCQIYKINIQKYIVNCIPLYNPNNSPFLDEDDYNNYGVDLDTNIYIPQGITKDNDGNLYISWYYGYSDSTVYDFESIVMKFNPETEKVIKIYPLSNSDFENDPHVGGIGYTEYTTTVMPIFPPIPYSKTFKILFVSDGYYLDNYCYVNIYQITDSGDIIFIDKKMVYDEFGDIDGVIPDGIGISNSYLWLNQFDKNDLENLMGYKIEFDYSNSEGLEVILGDEEILDSGEIFSKYNFNIVLPKVRLQGSYTISNPETDGRLKFYFTKSYGDAESFSFYGTLDYCSEHSIVDDNDREGFRLFLNSPSSNNPEGYQNSVDGKATAFIEDIKGVILWNLENSNGDADSWYLNKIEIVFDENSYPTMDMDYVDLYQAIFDQNGSSYNIFLGNTLALQKDGLLLLFNTSHDGDHNGFLGTFERHSGGIFQKISEVYTIINQCINNDIDTCLNSNLYNYVENNKVDFFCNLLPYLNSSQLNRFNDINISECKN